MFEALTRFIRERYAGHDQIPLHAPVFLGAEKALVNDAIDSTFVSSVGSYVIALEERIRSYTQSPAATAVVNGTAALHTALKLCSVGPGDLVITQPLTFVATCNAIRYCGADPVLIDVDRATFGLSAVKADDWLTQSAFVNEKGECRTLVGNRRIAACLPMHTFGHPADLVGLSDLCRKWRLDLIEDAAEALGSFSNGRHVGTCGRFGVLSFNGNKILTTGGGGMLLSSEADWKVAKHVTTTARTDHGLTYFHDEVGFNYRMPNINAALGCAQFDQLHGFLEAKRKLAGEYQALLADSELEFVTEPPNCKSNYWLNAVVCQDRSQRDALLRETNSNGIQTRPVWALMSSLPMYRNCMAGRLDTAQWLEQRVVNLPSGVVPELL